MTAKKCKKKRDARAELLFCLFNLLHFWRSRCRRRRVSRGMGHQSLAHSLPLSLRPPRDLILSKPRARS